MLHSTFLFTFVFSCLSLSTFHAFFVFLSLCPLCNLLPFHILYWHVISFFLIFFVQLPGCCPSWTFRVSSKPPPAQHSPTCLKSNTWPGNEVSAKRLSFCLNQKVKNRKIVLFFIPLALVWVISVPLQTAATAHLFFRPEDLFYLSGWNWPFVTTV